MLEREEAALALAYAGGGFVGFCRPRDRGNRVVMGKIAISGRVVSKLSGAGGRGGDGTRGVAGDTRRLEGGERWCCGEAASRIVRDIMETKARRVRMRARKTGNLACCWCETPFISAGSHRGKIGKVQVDVGRCLSDFLSAKRSPRIHWMGHHQDGLTVGHLVESPCTPIIRAWPLSGSVPQTAVGFMVAILPLLGSSLRRMFLT